MQDGLGPTLRKARNRRKETLSDVEAAIKIRVRHLRAIEEEDWEALPEGPYGRSFLRTYANYLGLDGDRLAAERVPHPEPLPAGPAPRRQLPRAAVTAAIVAGLVAVIAAVGLATGGGGGGSATVAPGRGAGRPAREGPGPAQPDGGAHKGVVLRLETKAEVWVCVLDEKGRPLVEGEVLQGGVEEGPFHSGSFTVAFGNGEVAMQVDGTQADIPNSASPLGYAIDPQGDLRLLPEGERPTCL